MWPWVDIRWRSISFQFCKTGLESSSAFIRVNLQISRHNEKRKPRDNDGEEGVKRNILVRPQRIDGDELHPITPTPDFIRLLGDCSELILGVSENGCCRKRVVTTSRRQAPEKEGDRYVGSHQVPSDLAPSYDSYLRKSIPNPTGLLAMDMVLSVGELCTLWLVSRIATRTSRSTEFGARHVYEHQKNDQQQ